MTYDYHVVLGVIAVAPVFFGYWFYIRSIFRGETKPHPFTWLLFVILDSTIFFAQWYNNGGPGAWPMAVGNIFAAVVFLYALRYGWKNIVLIDWVCLVTAILAIVAWRVTGNALYAVLFAAAADAIAKIPTIRKSYTKPQEESLSIWTFDMLRFSLSIAALSSLTWTTGFFPAEIVATNAVVVGTILLRRRQLAAEVSVR